MADDPTNSLPDHKPNELLGIATKHVSKWIKRMMIPEDEGLEKSLAEVEKAYPGNTKPPPK